MRFYSYRSASTVFLVAVRQLCQLTVSNTTATATAPAAANTHQLSAVFTGKVLQPFVHDVPGNGAGRSAS